MSPQDAEDAVQSDTTALAATGLERPTRDVPQDLLAPSTRIEVNDGGRTDAADSELRVLLPEPRDEHTPVASAEGHDGALARRATEALPELLNEPSVIRHGLLDSELTQIQSVVRGSRRIVRLRLSIIPMLDEDDEAMQGMRMLE